MKSNGFTRVCISSSCLRIVNITTTLTERKYISCMRAIPNTMKLWGIWRIFSPKALTTHLQSCGKYQKIRKDEQQKVVNKAINVSWIFGLFGTIKSHWAWALRAADINWNAHYSHCSHSLKQKFERKERNEMNILKWYFQILRRQNVLLAGKLRVHQGQYWSQFYSCFKHAKTINAKRSLKWCVLSNMGRMDMK